MFNIVSDCRAVTSLNDSGTFPDPAISIPVNSKDVGDIESQDTANLCTHNSTSIDGATTNLSAVGDKKSDDEKSSVIVTSTVSNTVSSATSTLGEDSTHAAQTSVGNEPLETTSDTDLAASASCSAADGQNVYHVKWIKFHGSQTPIVMQNQNGPCPLLAIVNVLLLQGKVKLSSSADLVASDQLMAYIADWIFDNVPKVC